MIRVPGDIGWVQNNRGDSLGTINDSFNLDLSSNLGKLRTTRTKRLAYTGTPTNFGQVVALERFKSKLYVAAENASGDDIWVGGNSPFDTLVNDTSSVEIVPSNSDMLSWNNGLYVALTSEIKYTTDGSDWSEVGTNVLTGDNHLLTSKNDVLYVSDELYKVKSVTSANSFQGTGSQTLDLNMPGYGIQMLMTGIDSIWVGLTSLTLGSPAFVFEWDGETENTPTARYEINATGIMAGVIKDGVPYIVDSNGRLLAFSGSSFVEIARFPVNGQTFVGFNSADNDDRAIHPKGMAVDGDEILICVANATEQTTAADFNEFPSGVWAYSETNGLYHKYSASFQDKGDTGTTNLSDHGQYRALSGGPLLVYETTAVGGDTVSANGGRVVFGLRYYSDATNTAYGLFADDTNDNTQKAGWYVSPRIQSKDFRDHWQKIYTALSDLETTGDLVEIKYRTKDETATYSSVSWGGLDRFTTNDELSSYIEGDEVTVVQGTGSGAIAHIKSISTDAGTQIILDRELAGVTGTSKVRFEKWKKVGSIRDIATKGFTLEKAQDHWIQVKLYMQWTGRRELHGILIENTSSLS